MKDSPSKVDQIGVNVRIANDAVQSIKQLRKEIVEIMSQLLTLAKKSSSQGKFSFVIKIYIDYVFISQKPIRSKSRLNGFFYCSFNACVK